MPRYIVQRSFADGLEIPIADGGSEICRRVVERNADEGVTWVHSYVSEDKRTSFCVYDAPSPENPQDRARNDLPVDQITRVRVLDPTSTPEAPRRERLDELRGRADVGDRPDADPGEQRPLVDQLGRAVVSRRLRRPRLGRGLRRCVRDHAVGRIRRPTPNSSVTIVRCAARQRCL